MQNGNRMVIGLDFEADGDAALTEALRLADGVGGAELHIVHVIAPDGHDTQKMERALEAAMAELRARLRQVTWPTGAVFELRLHVRFGEVAAALQQVAVDYDAHLIVVGTHGRRPLARAVLGSVADALVRTANLPVLVARPRNFDGLERTQRPAPGLVGLDVHRVQIVSEAIQIGPRTSHISGLI